MLQFIVRGLINETPQGFRKMTDHFIREFDVLSREERQELKREFPQGYFRLQLWERGGASYDNGEAQVVCGSEGERLVPVKIRRKGWLANDRHALFVGNELTVVHATSEKRDVKFSIVKYSVKAKIGIIEEQTIWIGDKNDLDSLPEEMERFREALETVQKKVLEYRCTKALYYTPKQ